MIPSQWLRQIKIGKTRKHNERDNLLNGFQLYGREMAVTITIGRHLKTIFKEGNQPADENHAK